MALLVPDSQDMKTHPINHQVRHFKYLLLSAYRLFGKSSGKRHRYLL